MPKIFTCFIPTLPPGINKTYLIRQGGKGLALTKEARDWDKKAALIIGAEAGLQDWQYEPGFGYGLVIIWGGGYHDADAHLKLVQDCVSRKLGFDDRYIVKSVIERRKHWDGLYVGLAAIELG